MAIKDRKTRTTSAHGPSKERKHVKSDKALTTKLAQKTKGQPNSKEQEKKVEKKVEQVEEERPRKRKAEEPIEKTVSQPKSTMFNAADEVDFPRGGGTTLTQVEVKEAMLEGRLEAMEQERLERKLNTEIPEKGKAKRRKLEREILAKSLREKNALPKDAFRIENLNYKRLVPGTKVLGQIIAIQPLLLIVSLPGQLLAHVPLTNVSEQLTARLEADAGSSDEDEEDEEDEPSLHRLFRVGEWVAAVVTEINEDYRSSTGGFQSDLTEIVCRKVELSLEPSKVNEGVSKTDIKPGFTLTASVKSIEDHGYVLSFGLPLLTSFLSFKDADEAFPTPLQEGQLISCRIKDINANGKTCVVTVGKKELIHSLVPTLTSIESVVPGALISGLITNVLPTGLNIKFHGFYEGTVNLFHLNGMDPEKDFKVGQKVKSRVMWDTLGTTPKRFGLSLANHVIGMDEFASEEGKDLREIYPIGKILDVTVVNSEHERGLTVGMEDTTLQGFVHISNISDEHLGSIPNNGPWKIGTSHKARVIGYSQADSILLLSLQKSILGKAFLQVSDVKIGETVKGTVKTLTNNALFVEISGNVDGVVFPLHYADIKLKHPEKRFKAGTSVKAKILSVNPERKRIVLTLKKSLIDSEHPLVCSFEDAKSGTITNAVVSKILPKAMLVDFFGGIRALVPQSEIFDKPSPSNDIAASFELGKVVLVQITNVDAEQNRIEASIQKAIEKQTEAKIVLPEPGTTTNATITALHETNAVLELESGAKGLISYVALARSRNVKPDVCRASLKKGDVLENLVVVSKNEEKRIVIVGAVAPKGTDRNADTVATNVKFESLAVGQSIEGKIIKSIPTGVMVQLSRTVRGRVFTTELADDYSKIDSLDLNNGTRVTCSVIKLETAGDQKKVELSLRPSRLDSGIKPTDVPILGLQDVKQGQELRGFVKNVSDHGLFVTLGENVTARVQIREMFDEYIKDWKSRFAVGILVTGRVKEINEAKNLIEFSLRKGTDSKKESKLEFSDFSKGQIIEGVVKSVQDYGAFIRIDGTSLSGLCHKSKVTDKEDKPWTEYVHQGDHVKAIITDIDQESKKISFALKSSAFPGGKSSEGSDEDLEFDSENSGSEEDDESNDDDEQENELQIGDSDDSDIEIIADSEGNEEEESEVEVIKPKKQTKTNALEVKSGFNWDGENESDSDDEKGSDEDQDASAAISKTIYTKPTTNSDAPTTSGDFEKLLLGSPNSSYLWIQYIAFYIGQSQYDKARETGKRALETINFREEQEKMNIWLALLNLENTYGTTESLENVFKDAAQRNDSKTIHLRLVDIYARSKKFEEQEELFKKIVKKFSQSSKVWSLFGQFYFEQGRGDEARELLPRSLKSLEKRKHVKTITKFAQLEFKLGTAERGRTIFEGIVDSYPKRLDLWMIYIDMEIKQRNTPAVRALFERVLAQNLSSKKGKGVFKKWLTFEKEFGDSKGEQICKERAIAFVESL